MKYSVQMDSNGTIYTESFMNIGTGIQVTANLKGCNVTFTRHLYNIKAIIML
jgi:hypothetical protein